MEPKQIEIRCTIELLAKPESVALDAIKKIVSNIEENGKKLEVREIRYGEPKKVEQDFYSVFATFTVKSDITSIFGFILDYAPSSIEVLSSGELKISLADLQGILNDLSGRLNEMDLAIKTISAQNIILSNENEGLKKNRKDSE
jgi:nucleoside diphosphate kinase